MVTLPSASGTRQPSLISCETRAEWELIAHDAQPPLVHHLHEPAGAALAVPFELAGQIGEPLLVIGDLVSRCLKSWQALTVSGRFRPLLP